MLISRANAQKIVEEMEKAINKNINIMDQYGCIIASTDPKRINQYHEGALKIINQSLNELIIDSNSVFAGSKQGINLPIVIDNKIIGVVGITGEYEQVAIFGTIIRKLTEILIKETQLSEQNQKKLKSKSAFLNEWIFNAQSLEDPTFVSRGKALGIDVLQSYVSIVCSLCFQPQQKSTAKEKINRAELHQKAQEIIVASFSKYQGAIVETIGSKWLIVVNSKEMENVFSQLEEVKKNIEKLGDAQFACGIGLECSSFKQMYKSFSEGEQACKASMITHDKAIRNFEDINFELLIQKIPYSEKAKFSSKIFRKCNEREKREWEEFLKIFFKNNGSINKCADDLFIHKNTMQYRLSKLKEITGYDPRIITEATTLHAALMISQMQ